MTWSLALFAKRSESPTTLLEQLDRIHQQTTVTAQSKMLTELTKITAAQKSLFAALELSLPAHRTSTNLLCSLRFGPGFQ